MSTSSVTASGANLQVDFTEMEPCMPDKPFDGRSWSPELAFRFRIVSLVRLLEDQGDRRSDAVRFVADTAHTLPGGETRTVGARTLWRWLSAYDKAGVAGLERVKRKTSKASRRLSAKLSAFLLDEAHNDPDASTPELIKRAKLEGHIHCDAAIDRTTVWRFLCRNGVEMARRKVPKDDTRRFAFPHRMQMVMADFVHFRAGPGRLRRLAVYFLDDATRFGLDVVVTTDGEDAGTVLVAVHRIIRRCGLMSFVYVDKGPGFIADVLAEVLGNFDIPVVLGTAGYPQGRGKIEVFNRSLRARLLRGLPRVGIDPAPSALELRLRTDLHDVYNHTPHESLKQKVGKRIERETPSARWHRDARALKPPPDDETLRQKFTERLERHVSADHIVSVDSIQYEVPRGLRGRKIDVWRRVLERTDDEDVLYVHHRDDLVRIQPVDLAHNATSGRQANDNAPQPEPTPVKTASDRVFDNKFSPMVAADGGYDAPDEDDPNH
jgi:transposase InsO family protein